MTFTYLVGVWIAGVVLGNWLSETLFRVCMNRQLSLLLFLSFIPTYSSRVVELNESFLQIVHDGPWLVNFYASWCGYCRRLAPTYEDVSNRLAELGSPIKVGRLDASSHRGLGRHFSVTGFPTIKYIDREVIVQYDGDRSTRNIVSFALRAHGSAVKVITSRADLERNVTFFGSDPFYVLINPRESALTTTFYDAAERFRLLAWFLSIPKNILPTRLAKLLKSEDSTKDEIVVFKDSDVLVYPYNEGNGRPQHLFGWILRERYPVFGRFELSDLWEFGVSELSVSDASTETTTTDSEPTPKQPLYRLVALFLVRTPHTDEPVTTRFLEMGRTLAERRLKYLVNNYLFGWSDATADVSELAMVDLAVPSLVVVDPVTQQVYLNPNQTVVNGLFTLEPEVAVSFFMAVTEGRVKAIGGNSFLTRLRRLGRKLVSDLLAFAYAYPMAAFLMISIPSLLASFVCYLCCCLDERYDEPMADESVKELMKPMDDASMTVHRESTSSTRRGQSVFSRSTKQYSELGPVDSKEVVDEKHAAYQEWKKNR
ncbi:hypothetical protein EG68_07142 [Paragonimus skrjabini miyazakii]|uniref:Thioredoxin domain-containing protein n=1 Tax=Paragonimus skrjabini miyazakii TaxID=59628 RepID=A0A8S9YN40_9TREM|nr:hypothetical protein EG68_07142 [Paragonimus skrjabini miyazakii]